MLLATACRLSGYEDIASPTGVQRFQYITGLSTDIHRFCTSANCIGFMETSDFESVGMVVKARENSNSSDCAAQGAAVYPEMPTGPSDLQAVIAAWPDLPESTKSHVMVCVRAASEPNG